MGKEGAPVASAFQRASRERKVSNVSWYVWNAGKEPFKLSLGEPERQQAKDVVLALYTANDEFQGLSAHFLTVEEGNDENLVDSVSKLAQDLQPTYFPVHAADSIQDLHSGPRCTPNKPYIDTIAHEIASSESSERLCLFGVSLIISRRPPPRRIPEHLVGRFTLQGLIPVHYDDSFRFEHGGSARCFTDSSRVHHCRPREYSTTHVDQLVAAVIRREHGYYGATDEYLYRAVEAVEGFEDLDVLVVGSVEPWYEAVCIAYGARSCTTIDYNPVSYHHPKLLSITVQDLQELPPDERPRFGAAISISSFEHDGLGRYGDPLEPEGDLRAMHDVQVD